MTKHSYLPLGSSFSKYVGTPLESSLKHLVRKSKTYSVKYRHVCHLGLIGIRNFFDQEKEENAKPFVRSIPSSVLGNSEENHFGMLHLPTEIIFPFLGKPHDFGKRSW